MTGDWIILQKRQPYILHTGVCHVLPDVVCLENFYDSKLNPILGETFCCSYNSIFFPSLFCLCN